MFPFSLRLLGLSLRSPLLPLGALPTAALPEDRETLSVLAFFLCQIFPPSSGASPEVDGVLVLAPSVPVAVVAWGLMGSGEASVGEWRSKAS